MRRLRFLLPALALLATLPGLFATSADAATCRGAHLKPSRAHAAAVRHATLCLLNRQRAAHGLRRLRSQPSLSTAATRYARLMVAQRFFDHVSPAGSTMSSRIQRTNYLKNTRSWSLGENIAWGASGQETPARIVKAWMHSAGHRANILNGAFREVGVGIALGAPNGGSGATYVNDFGRRA
ncbi:MAG TPA: CAP domain-containing protein [Baekduia sp.]|uniref:CAP domain-containing protein n=1 Tax=Baekduia sp. TaxID=2600305 RepID=UPI002D77681F|nr:CAP domain-containing protein [Baekduia sp.]HET6507771.1 CAP domain-containing protein [Baekduia sp.]